MVHERLARSLWPIKAGTSAVVLMGSDPRAYSDDSVDSQALHRAASSRTRSPCDGPGRIRGFFRSVLASTRRPRNHHLDGIPSDRLGLHALGGERWHARSGCCRLAVIFLLASSTIACAELPSADPASLGFDADRLKRIDGAIDRAIERKQVPGAVVLVGRRGAIAYARAAGRRVVGPAPEAMTRDTVFDMASLTKPVATATSVMILIEEGKVRLTDRLGRVSARVRQSRQGGDHDRPAPPPSRGADPR